MCVASCYGKVAKQLADDAWKCYARLRIEDTKGTGSHSSQITTVANADKEAPIETASMQSELQPHTDSDADADVDVDTTAGCR